MKKKKEIELEIIKEEIPIEVVLPNVRVERKDNVEFRYILKDKEYILHSKRVIKK